MKDKGFEREKVVNRLAVNDRSTLFSNDRSTVVGSE